MFRLLNHWEQTDRQTPNRHTGRETPRQEGRRRRCPGRKEDLLPDTIMSYLPAPLPCLKVGWDGAFSPWVTAVNMGGMVSFPELGHLPHPAFPTEAGKQVGDPCQHTYPPADRRGMTPACETIPKFGSHLNH